MDYVVYIPRSGWSLTGYSGLSYKATTVVEVDQSSLVTLRVYLEFSGDIRVVRAALFDRELLTLSPVEPSRICLK